jgi:hypothetical protein
VYDAFIKAGIAEVQPLYRLDAAEIQGTVAQHPKCGVIKTARLGMIKNQVDFDPCLLGLTVQ